MIRMIKINAQRMMLNFSERLLIKIAILSVCGLITYQVAAQSSPVPMLEQTAQQIVDRLKTHQSSLRNDPKIVHQAIRTYLLPHIDVEGMSRSVLGRQAWMKATPSERRAFEQEFTQLVIRTYAAPLAEYSGETVTFTPIRGNVEGRFVRVNSVIQRPNGQRIPLSYNLVAKANEWKVYDLSVEGVSLLQSFRTQFSHILQQGTMQDLLEQMRANQKFG